MDTIRVFLVEDNQATRDLLRAFLGGLPGIEVCGEAGDGKAGLELARRERPDLVLLDLVMPGLDGIGFLRALQEEDYRPKVIVLSGVGADEYVQRACELGAKFYLVKPVNLAELANHIALLFPDGKEEQPVRAGAADRLLLNLEADPRLEGFHYAAFAAGLFLENWGGRIQMKEIYLRTARRFGTSYSCVEKNLRTLVRHVHAAQTDTYTVDMGFAGREKQPENGAFLRALAEALRERM